MSTTQQAPPGAAGKRETAYAERPRASGAVPHATTGTKVQFRSQPAHVTVAVSSDSLSAFVAECRAAQGGGPPLDASAVRSAVRRAGVAVPADDGAVAEAVRLINAGVDARGLILARAVPARHGTDGRIEPVYARADARAHGALNGRHPVFVCGGELLARVVPGRAGLPGCDVRGRPLSARNGRSPVPSAGENVLVSPNGRELRSAAPGLVRAVGRRLSVSRAHKVTGDVDFRSGDLFLRDVSALVTGSIRSGRAVRCGGDLLVGGCIERARVEAGGDVYVGRRVSLGDAGCIEAGGSIAVRAAENGCLQAGGDVRAEDGIMDCRVTAGGRVSCVGGSGWIAGSEVYASSGIEAEEVGSGLTGDTRLVIGWEPDGLEALEEGARASALARLRPACRQGLKVRGMLHAGTVVEIAGRVRVFEQAAVRVRVYSDGPGLPVQVAAL